MGHVGEHFGITFTGDHCLEHLACRDHVHVSDDRAFVTEVLEGGGDGVPATVRDAVLA